MISFRALGVLAYISATNCPINVEQLKLGGTEGRDALYTALRELENSGLIHRQRMKFGKQFIYTAFVTKTGFQYLHDLRISSEYIQPYKQINHNLLIADISTKYTNEVREGYQTVNIEVENMPYEFFGKTSSDDDSVAERVKAQAEKKKAYEQAKQEKHARKIVKREDLPKSAWSSLDVGYEFADRLHQKWNIKPWSLRQSRFVPALGELRKRLNTNGEIEFIMLNLFFDSIDFEKYDDAEVLWKMFISRAPSLVEQARKAVSTPEDIEQAQIDSANSWKGIL